VELAWRTQAHRFDLDPDRNQQNQEALVATLTTWLWVVNGRLCQKHTMKQWMRDFFSCEDADGKTVYAEANIGMQQWCQLEVIIQRKKHPSLKRYTRELEAAGTDIADLQAGRTAGVSGAHYGVEVNSIDAPVTFIQHYTASSMKMHEDYGLSTGPLASTEKDTSYLMRDSIGIQVLPPIVAPLDRKGKKQKRKVKSRAMKSRKHARKSPSAPSSPPPLTEADNEQDDVEKDDDDFEMDLEPPSPTEMVMRRSTRSYTAALASASTLTAGTTTSTTTLVGSSSESELSVLAKQKPRPASGTSYEADEGTVGVYSSRRATGDVKGKGGARAPVVRNQRGGRSSSTSQRRRKGDQDESMEVD
jgi:hypothetical protein